MKSTEEFIKNAIKNKTPTSIFLSSGIRLQGTLQWTDKLEGIPFIGLKYEGSIQVINVSFISSIGELDDNTPTGRGYNGNK